MKRNLGKVFLVILLSWHVGLFASSYEWSSSSSKKEAYINEPIHLKYVCNFSDKGELYTIGFSPHAMKDKFDLVLLKKTDEIVDERRVSSFEYIAYVKEAGEIEFNFDVSMKKTTLEFINNSTLSRDDDRGDEEFSKKILRQKPLFVNIKDAKQKLVGEFELELKKDENLVKSYEPYHLEVTIKGSGNFEAIKPLEFEIEGVKVFSQKPQTTLKLTKDGYHGMWVQKFAFVSEKPFKIPVINIEYFDTKDGLVKELKHASIEIDVEKGFEKKELLDEEPKSSYFSIDFIYYILTFIAGFLFSKIKFKRKKIDLKDELFLQKINNSKTIDEIHIALILKSDKSYKIIIDKIEKDGYSSVSEVKSELKRLIVN